MNTVVWPLASSTSILFSLFLLLGCAGAPDAQRQGSHQATATSPGSSGLDVLMDVGPLRLGWLDALSDWSVCYPASDNVTCQQIFGGQLAEIGRGERFQEVLIAETIQGGYRKHMLIVDFYPWIAPVDTEVFYNDVVFTCKRIANEISDQLWHETKVDVRFSPSTKQCHFDMHVEDDRYAASSILFDQTGYVVVSMNGDDPSFRSQREALALLLYEAPRTRLDKPIRYVAATSPRMPAAGDRVWLKNGGVELGAIKSEQFASCDPYEVPATMPVLCRMNMKLEVVRELERMGRPSRVDVLDLYRGTYHNIVLTVAPYGVDWSAPESAAEFEASCKESAKGLPENMKVLGDGFVPVKESGRCLGNIFMTDPNEQAHHQATSLQFYPQGFAIIIVTGPTSSWRFQQELLAATLSSPHSSAPLTWPEQTL